MIRLPGFRLLRRMDLLMALVMFLLIAIGVAFVYSAEYTGGDPGFTGFYQRQLMWAAIGTLSFLVFAMFDYRILAGMSWWLYVGGIFLLILVLLPNIGHKIYGARRWIQIGGFRLLQPSELMKPALIILLAKLLGRPGVKSTRMPGIIAVIILTLLPVVLIMKQPDLGTSLIFLPILAAMIFAAGVRLRVLVVMISIGAIMCSVLLSLIVIPQKLGWSEEKQVKVLQSVGITPYQRNRLLVFVNSDQDPLGAGWNKAQSKIAIGSGGFWGKGYLRGTQNVLGFLPRTVAPNDFIFSVIAEEKGFSGSALTLFLFTVLLGCGLRAAAVARDKTGMLICTGIVTMLFCHVLINVAMTIGLLPVTGTPLPLVSYGGTFMVSVMSSLGIVQSIYIRGDRR